MGRGGEEGGEEEGHERKGGYIGKDSIYFSSRCIRGESAIEDLDGVVIVAEYVIAVWCCLGDYIRHCLCIFLRIRVTLGNSRFSSLSPIQDSSPSFPPFDRP